MIHLYARVSTDKQDNGREAQVARLVEWVGTAPHMLWVDEDVSAYSTPLHRRPQGKQMWDMMQKGDLVVVTKVDRAFRSISDMAGTRHKMGQLGIGLEILELPDAFRTAQGKLYLSIRVAFSEYESEIHGERKREAYAHRRKTGQPYNTIRPFGWLVVKKFDDKAQRFRPVAYKECQPERDLVPRILAMRERGMNWSLIADELICEGVRKPKGSKGQYYYASDLKMLVLAAEAGFPTVPQGAWQARARRQTQPAG